MILPSLCSKEQPRLSGASVHIREVGRDGFEPSKPIQARGYEPRWGNPCPNPSCITGVGKPDSVFTTRFRFAQLASRLKLAGRKRRQPFQSFKEGRLLSVSHSLTLRSAFHSLVVCPVGTFLLPVTTTGG